MTGRQFTLEQLRLRCYVDPATHCWHWRGYMKRNSPQLFMGRVLGRQVFRALRHVTWELLHARPFPPGHAALPSCGECDCVNPKHVRLMLHGDVRRMNLTGRKRTPITVARMSRAGAKRGKLTTDKVREIRARAAAGEQQRKLAREMGVSDTVISEVVRNLAWREASPWGC